MRQTAIAGLHAWQALDSRGNPTVGCEVSLSGGARGQALAPSGASAGRHEAVELRDREAPYGGLGVRRAVAGLNEEVANAVVGIDAADQRALDRRLRELDGTPQLSRLGGNAVLAVSIASSLAVAAAHGVPLYEYLLEGAEPLLPMPMVNVISGGAHARGLGLDVQDFLAIPIGASSFNQALEWCWRTRAAAARLAGEAGQAQSLVADEGGVGLTGVSNTAALELLARAIEAAGLGLGTEVAIAVDVAATQLYDGELYRFDGTRVDSSGLLRILADWCESYPVVSLEDPLAEDDWAGWTEVTRQLGKSVQLVGDDLFVTNVERLGRGIDEGVANAVLLKPNQCGTLTGVREALDRSREAGYATIISARSGDTEDSWLADLAVGWRAGQIKVGSTTRSERTAKWNRLLKIEAVFGPRTRFVRWTAPQRRPIGTQPGFPDITDPEGARHAR
jgi:enolase